MLIGHQTYGSGKEGVIVLHGWFGDHTAFQPTFPFLDTDRFTYAFVDYRGYGKSKNIPGEHTMKEIAADAISLADELGWNKFHVVGHSMGGMAAQRILVDAPGRVKSVVALTPVPAAGVPLDADGEALFYGAPVSDDNRRTIIDFTTGNRLSPKWVDWTVKCSRETTTQDAFADYLAGWNKTDFADEVRGIEVPVLVAVGEHDPAFTADVMKQTYMELLPNAKLETIANSGHYPMKETPAYLITLAEAFMAEHI